MAETQKIDFSELQADALAEILNIGVGRGAAGLSQLLNQEVLLSVPAEVIPQKELYQRLNASHGDELACIQQSFYGAPR